MMRKTALIIAFLSLVASVFGQPDIQIVTIPKTVGVYGLYEISFTLNSYDNPYDPEVIDVYADFFGPDGSEHRVTGFYYESFLLEKHLEKNYEVAIRNTEGDGWRIRFTPETPGHWTYVIHAVDQKGEARLDSYEGQSFSFECQARDAEGFIRMANSRYLKREVFIGRQRKEHSFFPVGPNVGWYGAVDYHTFKKPYGIYAFQDYIDKLAGNANYMRVWLSRYQYLSLYGPEHALRENGKPIVFFDSTLNQKDSEELDFIVSYAGKNGISLMLCLFTFGDFRDDSEDLENSEKYGGMPSGWRYNPYHTVLGLEHPLEFFTNPEAMRITKNLLRYIVSRWGYASNLLCWEFWNEVCNIFRDEILDEKSQQAIIDWHEAMAAWISSLDPYQHLISTSLGGTKGADLIEKEIYHSLSIVQDHNYYSIQRARSKEEVPYLLLQKTQLARVRYPLKPFFMGEYGMNSKTKGLDYESKDPCGVDLHNTLWASLFSGSMGPASFWYWKVLFQNNYYKNFHPVRVFCQSLPIPSDSFVGMNTGTIKGNDLVYRNNLETYYMSNEAMDTLYGWSHDVAFRYQSLRRLTDKVGKNGGFEDDGVFDPEGYVYSLSPSKKPGPSARNNKISIPVNLPTGTRFKVRWFDTETGLELVSEAGEVVVRRQFLGGKIISFMFPETIRDTKNGVITNTFGDAAFVLTRIQD